MQGTGRRLVGPGVDLVEVVGAGDVRHVALVVDHALRDHPTLHGELEFGIGFMEQPEVTGLARLVAHSPDEGAFVYPTGTVWSVAELVRELASAGETAGVKAGLELCYMAGEILVEAADQSAHSGLAGHGSVDPWKVVLKADGQVSIIGYGLPRPEIEAWLDDDTRLPSEDGLRYCAPENLRSDGQSDLSSDLFSLSLVALELMVGRPVYDGLVSDVKQQALRGEAARKLYQWRDRLPDPVREVLGKALKPDADTRFRDGLDFVYSVHDLLGGIDAGDGPSLRELVTTVRARQKRGVAALGGRTGSLSVEELAELAADIDAQGVATSLPAPRQPRPEPEAEGGEKPRWKRATRNRNGSEVARSPRRSRGGMVAEATPAPIAPPTAAPEDSARDRLLRRLRDRGGPAANERPQRSAPPAAVTAAAVAASSAPAPSATAVTENDEVTSSRRRRPGGRAAALLERLRSSSSETVAPTAPSERRRRGATPAPAEPRTAPPPRAEKPEPSVVRATPAPVQERPAPVPERVRAAPTVELPPPVVHHDPEPSEGPTEVLAGASSDEIVIAWQGRIVKLMRKSAPSASALADMAARELLLPRVDALGSRVAVFRLAANGRRVPASSPVQGLPPAVELQRIANQPRITTVVGDDGTRTVVALGEAVPVADLEAVLAGLLGLSRGFSVCAAGRRLQADEVLGDLDTTELEIRR
ncbi:MAG: hypothetical protein H6734_16750 [Alphaproteobacteria bacterium]|nr:hypothetical protein [Alphaproteobacteria bacterium]